LEFGRSRPRDLRGAFDHYGTAAAKGNTNALFNCGFFLQNGVGHDPDIIKSGQYYALSLKGSDDPDESAVFEYACCLQYGLLGFDEEPDEAFEFYGSIPRSEQSKHSFRCLRKLGRATLPAFPSRPSTGGTAASENYSRTVRNLRAWETMWKYLSARIGRVHGRTLSSRGSSEVRLLQDRSTGRQIVAKFVSGVKFDAVSFTREVENLTALNHPCVLRIISWALPEGNQCGEIHTEYAERGSLEDVLTTNRKNPDKTFWTATRIGIVICDIVVGMRFVHWKGIVHRDLKPSNVFIGSTGRAVIGDFGSSRCEKDDATQTGPWGTVHYAAPELFDEKAELTGKADVWSFGLILYEICTDSPAFPTALSPFDVIRQLRGQCRPKIPIECGDYMISLICRCWSDDPPDRPSFADILKEFQVRQFAILPGADGDAIRPVVDDVLDWEVSAEQLQSRS
jgi:hypothetical protein